MMLPHLFRPITVKRIRRREFSGKDMSSKLGKCSRKQGLYGRSDSSADKTDVSVFPGDMI